MKKIEIFTDGACTGNPGKGGYGAVLVYNGNEKELSRGFIKTTNNRMELMAAIEALNLLKEPCEVDLYSDSKYLTDAINQKWIDSWINNGWRKADKKKVLNIDLWEKIAQLRKIHRINFIWVKGHAGHKYNERCDKLAVNAYMGEMLSEDLNYDGNLK